MQKGILKKALPFYGRTQLRGAMVREALASPQRAGKLRHVQRGRQASSNERIVAAQMTLFIHREPAHNREGHLQGATKGTRSSSSNFQIKHNQGNGTRTNVWTESHKSKEKKHPRHRPLQTPFSSSVSISNSTCTEQSRACL